jgi:hypothetical protein
LCDPISAIALAGSAVAAGVNYAGQQATVEAQQNANDQWVQYQRTAAAAAAAKDEANRQKASAAEQQTLQQLSPQSQEATQQAAQANLNTQMLAGSPAAPDSNVAVLGGGDPANTAVTTDMAQRVTQAARAAQGRIAALAGLTSYGGGYGDMGQVAQSNISTGNEAIKLASDMRSGDTQTLGIAQQVQPVQFTQGSNVAGTVASQLANIAGSAFAKSPTGQSLKSAFS